MVSEPKEVELKLRIAPEDLPVLRNHPDFSTALTQPTHETLESVYFDSDGHLLREHGLSLRVRRIGETRVQTIKTIDPAGGSFERSEWEQVIAGDQPDLTVVDNTPLAAVLSDDVRDALKPVFETKIERLAYRLNGDKTAIAMAMDEGAIDATDASCPVSEIELELKHGDRVELFKVARAISQVVPVHLDVKSKSERGYELIEKKPAAAERAIDPKLVPGMSAGRAFTLIGRACLRHLVANESGVIRRDPEGLHQMRIALRRLRAAISLFANVVNDDRRGAIGSELRWLARELAPARDLDSFMTESFKPLRKQHANEPGLVSIGKMFARKRLKSYQQARAAIQSPRFRALVLDTAEWIDAGPWSTSEEPLVRAPRETPIEVHAANELARRRKKIRRRGAKIGELSPDQLHRLRIQIKKTRYAAEFFGGAFPGKKSAKRQNKALSALRQLQNNLGEFNDVLTRKALCSEIMANPGRGLTEAQRNRRAFAAGLIIGGEQAKLEKSLNRARKAHSRFDDAKIFWRSARHSVVLRQPVTSNGDQASGEGG